MGDFYLSEYILCRTSCQRNVDYTFFIDSEVNLLKKVRLEIAVNQAFVKPCVEAIIRGARSGEIGDGKIFVMPLEECYRIRTGETGSEAIG